MNVRVLPELSSVILTLIATFILFLGLRKLLYKPVSKILNDRKENIKNEIDEAKEIRQEAMKLKDEYEARIAEARQETQEIIESGRKRGEEVKESIVTEAKEEANSIIEKAKKEIEAEKEKALLDIKTQSGEMAILIASKIIQEEMDSTKQQKLINKFVDEVGSQKWQI
ncbi:F0F1 ATP synthase subunit B [Schnuerera sp. xch1]|uniref:F0F1 ATP synthase subunit B n=1 Tax=Schnuerera sp. xch1 TaxID=2874283 RepID=UPI001CC15789|nr:F0F1 ATP synthase subunit B [Schnuerera sp. xch1]MBZ2174919.1 F0F1 ATP synthase subunit B [Schnuerera sp. xch1]